MRRRGFTLTEILIAIAIIGLLATLGMVAAGGALRQARDVKRKTSIAQIGRFLAGGQCYMPDAGAGDYDLGDIIGEVKAKFPQYAQYMSAVPKDPRGGTEAVTKFRYVVTGDGQACALYANLENKDEPVTLTSLTAPTPGGGSGVFDAAAPGPNGTTRFYQASNK
ncbi:MAG TPA: prepilin-type N-terminal cleavage/methylation domain-containing protein [Candidatus Eisenbacteria bacterium]|jgi:prepilin-type N-terminal cleavage/methylation domain-containing protein|nr:prepilin-type N-terminal cleavage/methylation domain-containing protein [Candidatus Eisenbacteria bacterium]